MTLGRKRITYIHQHFKTPQQAGGTRSWEFARRLVQTGYEVTIISGGPVRKTETVEGVHVVQIKAPYSNQMSKIRRIGSFLSFMLQATLQSVRVKSDLIFATSTPLTVAVPGLIAAQIKRVPFIFEVRDLWPEVPVAMGAIQNPLVIRAARLLECVAYHKADRIIALSPGMAAGVTKIANDAEVATIPNACDFDIFDRTEGERQTFRAQQGWRNDTIALIYAGSFGESYNLEWLVSVAAKLPKDRFLVKIIGAGKSSQKLAELAETLGLDSGELLPGAVPKSEVAKWVSSADAVFSTLDPLPQLEMNSLNKVFDAMAASKPIIFNHGGWLTEEVTAVNAGWRLSRDPNVAAEDLLNLIESRHQLKVAGTRNRELGEQHFSRNQLFSQFAEQIELALDES